MIKYIPIMKAKVKKYIIKIGDDQYVRVMPEGISIINNFKKATIFNRVGDVIAEAGKINEAFGGIPVARLECIFI